MATADKMSQVLKNTGSYHVLVIHSDDGLDEISISADTQVFELVNGEIRQQKLRPEDMGIQRQVLSTINGGDAETNAGIIRNMLKGIKGPQMDITAFNAGAAIYTSGHAASIHEGVKIAYDTILSGRAKRKLADLINFSSSVPAN